MTSRRCLLLLGGSILLFVWSGRAASADEVHAGPPGQPAARSEPTHLAGYERVRTFGGPTSVSTQIYTDHLARRTDRLRFLTRALRPYYDFKSRLKRRYGLAFGLDYSILYQYSTARLAAGPDDAAGGVFRFYGHWALAGRGTDHEGAFVWKVENRSALGTNLSPSGLGPAVGSLFPSATTFSDWGWGITNLQWQQHLRIGRARGGFAVGQVDATDWLGVLDLANPWTGFVSTIPVAYPTNPTPDQGLGAMAFVFLGDRSTPYVLAGVSDANGEPTHAGFDTLFDVGELYSYAEIGWTPSYDRRYDDNIHVSFWHQDARMSAGTPEGWGLSATATWKFCDDRWHPFVHAGYSSGGLAFAETSVSLGTGYYLKNRDVLGFAANWARPPDDALRDQYSFELFYNLGLGEHVHLTPDLQVVVNPSSNPGEDVVGFLGARLRVDF